MRILSATLFFGFLCSGAMAQSAAQTEPGFIQAFDARLTKDGLDPVRSCQRENGGRFLCTFEDDVFLATVSHDDATASTGAGASPTSLAIDVRNGSIASLHLNGDRASPADLLNFSAHFESLLHALAPSVDDYTVEEDTLNLGVMRGDGDADIGRERTVKAAFASMHCLNQPFEVSVAIACTIEPVPDR